jgi:hypothetical protein
MIFVCALDRLRRTLAEKSLRDAPTWDWQSGWETASIDNATRTGAARQFKPRTVRQDPSSRSSTAPASAHHLAKARGL